MLPGRIAPKTAARDAEIFQRLRRRAERGEGFPTVRELAAEAGLSSVSMAQAALDRLEAKGLLIREGRRRRLADSVLPGAVPVLGTIAAGTPLMAVEQIEGYVQVLPELARGRELFALRVRGDSMVNAGILNGDTVVLEQTPTVENGEIAAVWWDDAATVKRFYREGGRFRLQPENDEMEPIYTDHCTVLGRVIALVRSYE